MKKIIALTLALVLSLGLIACGASTPAPVETKAKNAEIIEFVEKNKSDLLKTMEESFATSSGMTCTSDIKVEGMGFIISININELENIDDATKTLMQETYDAMGDIFTQSLSLFQQDLPTLEYYQVQVCEKDGDLLATITAGNK